MKRSIQGVLVKGGNVIRSKIARHLTLVKHIERLKVDGKNLDVYAVIYFDRSRNTSVRKTASDYLEDYYKSLVTK
jgi:hypothetical protein